MQDEIDVTGTGTATVVISGLSGSSLYDLYIYSDRQASLGLDGVEGGGDDVPFNNTTIYTIGATSYTTIPNDASTTGFTLTEDYVHFSNLSPVSNQITLTFTSASGGFGAMNGFQLVPIAAPEPSGITLLLLGSAAMFRIQRRRNK